MDELSALTAELAALLEALPAAALEAFEGRRDELCAAVDRALAERLEPEAQPDLEFVSAGNFHKFIGNVLHFRRPGLLVSTLPWLYRSLSARGLAPDFFPGILGAWTGAVERALPPAAAGPLNGVFRWVLSRHGQWARLSGDLPPEAPPAPPEALCAQFLALLLAGARLDCIRLAEAHVRTPAALAEFYGQVLTPALYEVGRLWEAGAIRVAEEHRASAIARQTCDALYHLLMPFKLGKGRAVIACSVNEAHDLGGRILADLLAGDGWDVDFLGADSSEEDLLRLLRSCRPHVLGLSLAMPFNLLQARRLIERARGEPGFRGSRVIVGGAVFRSDPDLWRALGADGHAASAGEALRLLDGWWGEMQHDR